MTGVCVDLSSGVDQLGPELCSLSCMLAKG
jgi:hypothetical protein